MGRGWSLLLTIAPLILESVHCQSFETVLSSDPELSNLTSLLGLYPSLVSTLSSLQNVTFIADTNRAWAAFLNSSRGAAFSAGSADADEDVFVYHILNGSYDSFNGDTIISTALQESPITHTYPRAIVKYEQESSSLVSGLGVTSALGVRVGILYDEQ